MALHAATQEPRCKPGPPMVRFEKHGSCAVFHVCGIFLQLFPNLFPDPGHAWHKLALLQREKRNMSFFYYLVQRCDGLRKNPPQPLHSAFHP